MNKQKLSNDKLRKLIQSFGGKFFSVTFTKKDGSLREMSCRLGVQKGVKGTGKPLDYDKNHHILKVYDTNNGFRTVNLSTVSSISCGDTSIQRSLN